MQILFNELSLTGQFSDQDAFIRNGLLPFVGVLKEMQGFSTLLLKKSDVWDKMITPTSTLYSLLIDNALRTFDEVRRLKSAIVDLTKEPFWDSDSKQNPASTYLLDGADIRGSSPAEACERDKVVVSFVSSSTSVDPLDVIRNGINVPLTNLTCSGKLTELLWTEVPQQKNIQIQGITKIPLPRISREGFVHRHRFRDRPQIERSGITEQVTGRIRWTISPGLSPDVHKLIKRTENLVSKN